MKRIITFVLLFLSVLSNAQTAIITTVVGTGIAGFSGDGAGAINANINTPHHITFDRNNNMYIADNGNLRIRKVTPEGVITTVAGNGTTAWAFEGALATASGMHTIYGVAVDSVGNIYYSDYSEHGVRKINGSGHLYRFAGYGIGLSDGPATARVLNYPDDIVIGRNGDIYIVPILDNLIRKVDDSGMMTTFAGRLGPSGAPDHGDTGDGGPATAALMWQPVAICFDNIGNAYISDQINQKIRKIDTFGIITTFAGTGFAGFSGDGGPATAAMLKNPAGLAADDSGNIYIADVTNHRIRKVSPTGIITTIAGTGVAGYNGDNLPARCTQLSSPIAVVVGSNGDLYISDMGNNRIRKISSHSDYFSDSMNVTVNKLCNGPGITILKQSYSPTLTIKSWFGDNTTTITPMTSCGSVGTASISHSYTLPGTYSIKHTLYDGLMAIDSVFYSYDHHMCNSYVIKLFNDYNGDCVKNGSEPFSMTPFTIEVDSNSVPVDTISGLSGIYYSAYGITGDVYSFRVLNAPPGMFVSCPTSGIMTDTLQIGSYGNSVKYFGLGCETGSSYDVAEFVTTKTGRHIATGSIVVNNSYCNPEHTIITMHFSPDYILESAYPIPSYAGGNVVTWDLGYVASNLPHPPIIGYTLTVPTPSIPSTWLLPGDTINLNVIANPSSGDVDTSTNVVIRVDTVKSSYDPNEVSVYPQGSIYRGTKLRYTVQFENTGNDTAHNIYIGYAIGKC